MKKRFLAIAIAAGLASPFAANADTSVYGRVHVSLDNIETGGGAPTGTDAEFDFSDRKSAFGVKGSEDLGDGMSAIYKVEWSFDPTDGGAIGTRDRWVGLKGGMGTVTIGTVTSSYKKTMAIMDPFWHTAGEGRAINSTSDLGNGLGNDRGRMTNAVQYHSPKMGGMQAVVNISMDGGAGDKNTGLGLRYETKGLFAFFDYVKMDDTTTYVVGESAMKFGAKYTMDALTVGLTLEQTEDLTGFDYTNLMATYALNANDTLAMTYGSGAHITNAAFDTDSIVLGYIHSMSKRTSVYAAYADVSSDTTANEASGLTFGLKHSF
ncbi:MAG: porin [Gammaproteobacteria bacterium]|nr:porin [Gammaproteobacteria bacterium]